MNLTRLIINASNYLLPNRGRPHMNHDCIKGARVFAGVQLSSASSATVNLGKLPSKKVLLASKLADSKHLIASLLAEVPNS
jgi:hypothetical protein